MAISKSSNSLLEDQYIKQSGKGYFNQFLQESVEVRYVCVIHRHRFTTMARYGQRNSTAAAVWVKLYETSVGLESHSRRPKRSPATKTGPNEVAMILELRTLRNLGARRIQSELKRLRSLSLAIATIHKILCRYQAKPVVKFRRKAGFIRYERPVSGDRVQMDMSRKTAFSPCHRNGSDSAIPSIR